MMTASPTALHPAPNFNRLADVYRWTEWITFGPLLALCRNTYLHRMRSCRRALIIGDGDGRFTAKLLRSNPDISADVLDASPAMLSALTQRAAGNSPRLRTHCLDARDWQPDGAKYDLIVTHFFLDCLTTDEVRALAHRIRSAAAPDAIWVVSEFAIPHNLFGHLIASPLVRALYWAFGSLTGLSVHQLPDYSAAMRSVGLMPLSRKSRLSGLLACELWVCNG